MERFEVAVVVFAEAPGVDALDAANRVELALRQLLRKNGGFKEALVDDAGYHTTDEKMPVRMVMEVGMAAGNGYLWMQPTKKAKKERHE